MIKKFMKGFAMTLLCTAVLFSLMDTKESKAEGPTPDARAIVAYSESYNMGSVSALKNGVTFQNNTYASNTDYIAITAIPNSGYSFDYFTDNGVIVTKSSYYTFNPGYYDHTVVAHFVMRNDNKDKDDKKKKTPQVNWANSACVYAPGYNINATSITTSQVAQGKECVAAFDSVKGDFQYIGMYNISFAHAGNQIKQLDHKVQLLFDIPAQYQKAGREFAMLRVYQGQPAFLQDLGNRGNKVLFETDCTAAYALVYRDGGGLLPASAMAQQQQAAALAQQQQAAALAQQQQAAALAQQQQAAALAQQQQAAALAQQQQAAALAQQQQAAALAQQQAAALAQQQAAALAQQQAATPQQQQAAAQIQQLLTIQQTLAAQQAQISQMLAALQGQK